MKSVLEKTRLPEGFRDFGPEAAQALSNLSARLERLYSSWGYRRVLTPSIEAEEVIAPGLGAGAAEGAFRMVDPLTGHALVFRPDITPQVARLVATGAAGKNLPIKLCYRGSVVRRLAEGGHGAREVYQSGIENFGSAPELADAEVAALALDLISETGLKETVLELGDVRFVEGVLDELKLGDDERQDLTSAIDRKARAEIDSFLSKKKLAKETQKILEALPDLFGGEETLARAGKLSLPPKSKKAVESLKRLAGSLSSNGKIPARLCVDLAEVRGLDYYTGLLIAVYAPGASRPILRGGRYDNLAARFGRDLPAVGFGVDLELLAGLSRAKNGEEDLSAPDVLLFDPQNRAEALLSEAAKLRAKGRRVFLFTGEGKEKDAQVLAKSLGIAKVQTVGNSKSKR
ncbi:MAG: ATP phosphoribosyltransferase regulatory subunit [Bdellovibrionota bacterium]